MRVILHVRPGAARREVGGCHGEALVVRVPERAVDGKATDAALRALAAALGIPRAAVRLVTGATSRAKVVELSVPDGDGERVAAELDRLRTGG